MLCKVDYPLASIQTLLLRQDLIEIDETVTNEYNDPVILKEEVLLFLTSTINFFRFWIARHKFELNDLGTFCVESSV